MNSVSWYSYVSYLFGKESSSNNEIVVQLLDLPLLHLQRDIIMYFNAFIHAHEHIQKLLHISYGFPFDYKKTSIPTMLWPWYDVFTMMSKVSDHKIVPVANVHVLKPLFMFIFAFV